MRFKRLVLSILPMMLLVSCDLAVLPTSSASDEPTKDWSSFSTGTSSHDSSNGGSSAASSNSSSVSSKESSIAPSHVHTFENEWSYDKTYHWRNSTCGHDEVGDKEKHRFVKTSTIDSTYESGGYSTYGCSICHYSYNGDGTGKLEHLYSDEWSSDENSHWHACIDEGYKTLQKDTAEHIFVANEDGDGASCSVCGRSFDCDKNISFKLSDDKKSYVIVDCSTSLKGNLVVPSAYKGLPVTKIGNEAFYSCNFITSVVIPSSIVSISGGAFSSCSALTSIEVDADNEVFDSRDNCNAIIETATNTLVVGCKSTSIPASVTSIGNRAFSGCKSLPSISIPSGVTSIGESAFSFCSFLLSASIPSSVTFIGNSAFYNCKSLTSVSIPSGVSSIRYETFCNCSSLLSVDIPASVTSIGYGAFNGCGSLASISFSTSIVSIDYYAFAGCISLKSLFIPASVVSIRGAAFGKCISLSSINVDENNEVYDSRENCNAIIETATNTLVVGCRNTVIPDEVTSIGDSAFSGCKSLTSISIPSGVTSIGNFAFGYCSYLTSIEIPDSVTSIGDYAFEGCEYLRSIAIPDSVVSIGYNVFYGCSFLNFTKSGGLLYYGNDANPYLVLYSDDDDFIGDATIHDGTKIIADKIFEYCSSITSVVIPSSVVSISDYAFYSCSNLTSVSIQPGVTSIGNRAFGDCKSLTSISIPDGVTSIGNSAFSGCYSLTAITIPNSIEYIGYLAFSIYNIKNYTVSGGICYLGNEDHPYSVLYSVDDKSTLKNVTIHPDTKVIMEDAFKSCYSLRSVFIPDGVTCIGASAFYNCSNLTAISIPSSVASIGSCAFSGCSSLISIKVDANNVFYDSRNGCNAIIETATNTLLAGCNNTNIPNGVVSIGREAFYHSQITSISIPRSVTIIDNHAFASCNLLRSIAIPDSVVSISEYAFSGCVSLTSIVIPNSVVSIGGSAFSYCKSLAYISIPNSVTSIGYAAFDGCQSLISIFIPSSVTSIGDGLFRGCESLTSIKIDKDNKVYDSRDNCNAIIESATNTLVAGCGGTFIPTDVVSIGKSAFYRSSLTDIAIPNSVVSIGDSAFYYCKSLVAVSIPDSVTSIGPAAFDSCTSLTSVFIPSSVIFIGRGAFRDCTSLASIKVDKDNKVYDSRDNCNAIIETATNAFVMGCKGTVIPSSVTSIADYAYYWWDSLTSITIPSSISYIGYSAFSLYSELSKVYYAGTPEQWDEIKIDGQNENLISATRYYFSSKGEEETEPGNWWYYDATGNIVEKVVEEVVEEEVEETVTE